MNRAVKNYARLGSQLFAVVTVVRQLRHAREDRDGLRLLDAAANAAAVLTAVLLILREIREHPIEDAEGAKEAVEEAPL